MVCNGIIKLADFGLSKRNEETFNPPSKLFGVIPYVDPKCFSRQRNNNNQYILNEKSIYSIGVLLWEIFSGKSPFCDEPYDVGLAMEILQGYRETPTPSTPENYIKIYTGNYNLTPLPFTN